MSNRNDIPDDRPSVGLPVQAATCTIHATEQLPAHGPVPLPERGDLSNPADCRFGLPEQVAGASRTEQSLRAERAYGDWQQVPFAERPLASARAAHAAALDAVMRAHGVSILALASMLGVNERQARKYIELDAPIPTTIFNALPRNLADDFAARIGARDTRKSGAEKLREALAELERTGASDALLLEAHTRLGGLAARKGPR